MAIKYRHSDGSGGHVFYHGVVGEPGWDEATGSLILKFEDGETRTFGPNPDGEPIAYGRLLLRDEGTYVDEETGLVRLNMSPDDPDVVLFNCTFNPVAD